MEADKDAAIRDLEAQIEAAGMQVEQSSAVTSSLQQQLAHRQSRDAQIEAHVQSTKSQAAQLMAMAEKTGASNEQNVRFCLPFPLGTPGAFDALAGPGGCCIVIMPVIAWERHGPPRLLRRIPRCL